MKVLFSVQKKSSSTFLKVENQIRIRHIHKLRSINLSIDSSISWYFRTNIIDEMGTVFLLHFVFSAIGDGATI